MYNVKKVGCSVPQEQQVLTDLGSRVELVSMDPQCNDISIGLYMRGTANNRSFITHTYSSREGAAERTQRISKIMGILGGMMPNPEEPRELHFRCGYGHIMACRRLFLDAAKTPDNSVPEPKQLEVFAKKAEQTIEACNEGTGQYLIKLTKQDEEQTSRVAIAALGLVKLADLEQVADTTDRVRFACGTDHDELLGLLLSKALNVRAAAREIEAQAARGVLAAPSSQSL